MSIDHKARAHAPFAPSASDRWLPCPASVTHPDVRLTAKHGEFWRVEDGGQDSWHTARGTAMHELADWILTHGTPCAHIPDVDWETHFTDPGTGEDCVIPADEARKHVEPFVEGVRQVYLAEQMLYGDKARLVHEVRVKILGDLVWGSVDAAVISPGMVYVADLKCGAGKIVSADCAQLKTYACGLAAWTIGDDAPPPLTQRAIVLQIFQADAPGGGDVATLSGQELLEHGGRIVAAVAESKALAQAATEPTEASIGGHCDWCPRKTKCPAHHQRALGALALADSEAQVATLPEDKLAWLCGIRRQLVAILDAAEEEVTRRLLAGQQVDGWKLVEGRSVRQWRSDLGEEAIAAEIASMADMVGAALDPWQRKLRSFTEVEKVIGKGVVDHLVIKPEGKPTLAPASDKRQAIAIKDNRDCLK